MSYKKTQAGVGVLVIFIAVAVIAAIGLVGYKIYNSKSDNKVTSTSQPAVKSDLKKTSDSLDAQPIEKDLDPSQLDKDINNLL